MSTLKDLTWEKHKEAEAQPFIKSIFKGQVDVKKYTDYLFQLFVVYNTLEHYANERHLFRGIEGIKRAKLIEKDWLELNGGEWSGYALSSTAAYANYLDTIRNDDNKLLAHIYVRHMGDMFGGQALAKLCPGSNNMFKFDDIPTLINGLREKLDVSMAAEANKAFDFNIAIIKEFNDRDVAASESTSE